MYKAFKGGSSLTIQEDDLSIEVHLPPVGYGYDPETQELVPTDILSRSNIKKEQYWEKPLPPKDYDKKKRAELRKQQHDPEYYDPDLNDYADQEWNRRKHGVWFKNNGKNVYLTGLHYYYLTHWRIDIGSPRFRMVDLEWFYFRAYCDEDPDCLGMLEITRRRQGKTFRAGAWLTERITRRYQSNGGIQSKTNEDAKNEVFLKAVVYPFKKLPDFFKPLYNTDKGDTPSSMLEFRKNSRRGKYKYEFVEREELESKIDFRNSGEKAYDGSKLVAYVADEVSKVEAVDILERHSTVRYCMEVDGEFVGKAMYTTTVEEMKSGDEGFKKFWEASDQSKKKAFNQTTSGLYRYFCPAYKTAYMGFKEDKYGYVDEDKIRDAFLTKREALMDDPKELSSFKRKNPLTWEEAFKVDSQSCIYNTEKLYNRQDQFAWMKGKPYRRGNLVWNDDKTKVEFKQDNHTGKFYFATLLDDNMLNRVKRVGENRWIPLNVTDFVIGIDPFQHDKTKDNSKASKGSAHAYWKFSSLDEMHSDNFICRYNARPPKASMFYEDMIKLCHYLGCKMLYESNAGQGIKNYFIERGYSEFFFKPEGIAASKKMHQELTEVTEAFIEDNAHRVMFPETIKDWLEFDIDNTQKYDDAMSSGITLIAATDLRRRVDKMKKKNRSSKQIVRTYTLNKKSYSYYN